MEVIMDWGILNINVPRDEMLLLQTVPSEIRQLDLTEFRYAMHDKQDDIAGMPFLHMHEHNPPVLVSGVELAQVVTIVNNYTVTFEDGLYNVNIVGGNSNVGDNVIKNQVGVNTANSAGLQESGILQYSSYNGVVSLDRTTSNTGTLYPVGNMQYPVNNAVDALGICNQRGFSVISLRNNYDFIDGDNVSDLKIIGISHVTTAITIEPEVLCEKTIFTQLDITGTLDGDSEITDCVVKDLIFFNGHIHNSSLAGKITLGGGKPAKITHCTMLDFETPVTIDAGGSGQNAVIDNYTGKIKIDNLTGPSLIGISLHGGMVEITSNCTSGTIVLQGNFELTDNSGIGCTVITNEKLMVHHDIPEIAEAVVHTDFSCP